MARQKKEYKPIAGQKWWEKILDWITLEDSFKFSLILLTAYALLLLIPIYIMTNNSSASGAAETFMKVWLVTLFPISALAMLNPCSAGWGLRMEQKLQQPIKDYVEENNSCTYDELIVRFMPVKIHLGIDDTLEHLLDSHELVLENDRYRLPTLEEKINKKWVEKSSLELNFSNIKSLIKKDD